MQIRANDPVRATPAGDAIDPARVQQADKAARELETAFARLLIGSMRAAGFGGDALFPGAAGHYRDMYDSQLADTLTSGRGLGLQESIRRQLLGASAPAASSSVSAPARGTDADAGAKSAPAIGAPGKRTDYQAPATPEDFVSRVWPHAVKAGEELGVPPRMLVAQAALETGWGRHMPRHADGSSSQNLFGIKAGSHWHGGRTQQSTTEFVDGVARRESADFRTYDAIADSFSDYVRLLKSSPRYVEALNCGGDGLRFAHALQRAGYATDPDYAAKLTAIAGGPTLGRALAQIDRGPDPTLRA